MFCGNCGANNPDDAGVCGSCGAALTPEETVSSESPVEAASSENPVEAASSENPVEKLTDKLPGGDKNKYIGLAVVIGGAVLAIALIVWIFSMLLGGSGGPGAVATDYIKASMNAKGGKTLISLIPNEIVKEALEQSDDFDTKAEMIRELNDYLEDTADYMEDYYGKYKVKVEVRKVKNWKNSEVKNYNERLENRKIDMEIKDGADVDLKVTINGKDDKDTSKPTVQVIKVGGKWYVDPFDADVLDYLY